MAWPRARLRRLHRCCGAVHRHQVAGPSGLRGQVQRHRPQPDQRHGLRPSGALDPVRRPCAADTPPHLICCRRAASAARSSNFGVRRFLDAQPVRRISDHPPLIPTPESLLPFRIRCLRPFGRFAAGPHFVIRHLYFVISRRRLCCAMRAGCRLRVSPVPGPALTASNLRPTAEIRRGQLLLSACPARG